MKIKQEMFMGMAYHMPVYEHILKQEDIEYALEYNGETCYIHMCSHSKAKLDRVCSYLQGAYRAVQFLKQTMQPTLSLLK